MRTNNRLEEISAGKRGARVERDPAELWLDQSITGEDLIKLDPLDETEDMLALTDEVTGDFIDGLELLPVPESVQQLVEDEAKARQQAEHGLEAAAELAKRIWGH